MMAIKNDDDWLDFDWSQNGSSTSVNTQNFSQMGNGHYLTNANTSQHCICRLWCHVDVSIERGATSEKESLLVQSQGSKEDISGKSDQSRGS